MRANDNSITFDSNCMGAKFVTCLAVAGSQLLLLRPCTVAVTDEHVGCPRVGPFGVVTKCPDNRRIAAHCDGVAEVVPVSATKGREKALTGQAIGANGVNLTVPSSYGGSTDNYSIAID